MSIFISQEITYLVFFYSVLLLSHLSTLPSFFWSQPGTTAQFINTSTSFRAHIQSLTFLSYLDLSLFSYLSCIDIAFPRKTSFISACRIYTYSSHTPSLTPPSQFKNHLPPSRLCEQPPTSYTPIAHPRIRNEVEKGRGDARSTQISTGRLFLC